MPQGESQAGQGSAQAAPVAPPMPTTVTEVQQPNWWVVPKAPHPKLLPAAIAPALHADNTAREGKNQYVANFFSYLTTQEKFETVQEEFFQVGHTHNEQDQRFSSVATLLSRARTLESPEDFKDYILKHVQPPCGRALHVEVLNGTWDFQKWFEELGCVWSGLTSTHLEPEVNHVWRFVPAHMVPHVAPNAGPIDVAHKDWATLALHRNDAVLLTKKYMHSQSLSQSPLLVQPAEIAARLEPRNLKALPLNDLGTRTLREFRKPQKC